MVCCSLFVFGLRNIRLFEIEFVMISDVLLGVVIKWCGFLLVGIVEMILWVCWLIRESVVLVELRMIMLFVWVVGVSMVVVSVSVWLRERKVCMKIYVVE